MAKLSTPLVSVIIPTFNEKDVIERLLVSIKSQSYANTQIIVVDDASSDNTVLLSRKYTKYVYKRSHAERSVQRNFGASKALGKYLLFLDADMQLSKNVIKECVEIAKEGNIGGVVIPEVSKAITFWERVKAFERSFYNESGDDATDAARFFPVKVFRKVGGYDEKITGPEDWDLPESIMELGYKIKRIKAVIYHYERFQSLFSLAKKKYYYGLRSHTYLAKHKTSLVSRKTIYFLRPVFYKYWKRLLANPVLSIAMFVMFSVELFAGGLGYMIGRVR